MKPGLAARLLSARDQGSTASGPARALALLGAAAPGQPTGELLDLPMGEADRRLLALRRRLLGERLHAVADCPGCGSATELALELPAIALPPVTPGVVEVRHEGWTVTARPPTLADLLAIAAAPDMAAARAGLQARCLLHARHGATHAPTAAVPEAVLEAVATALAEADPQADIELALTCPACGTAAVLPFDIGGFLWREVESWSARLLAEVHELALAYGWTEQAILGLSPQRRQHYLGLLGR